jgi:hypothetical protein
MNEFLKDTLIGLFRFMLFGLAIGAAMGLGRYLDDPTNPPVAINPQPLYFQHCIAGVGNQQNPLFDACLLGEGGDDV